jgi:hypothetical protein
MVSYTTNGVPTQQGRSSSFLKYINTPSTDTTDPISGPVIDNSRGDIEAVYAYGVVTDKTGTNPTLQLQLKGCGSATGTFAAVPDSSGTAITSGSASDISTADSTNVALSIDTKKNGRDQFPPFIKVAADLGGTNTPGWKGNIDVVVQRRMNNAVVQSL